MIDRRQFIGAALAAARAAGQTATWPSPVLDVHLHPRHGDDHEIDHLHGAGIMRAVLLPSLGSEDRVKGVIAEHPKQFVRFANADVRLPGAISTLRAQLVGGAIGMGELKYPVDIDGPEMRRVYDLAAEMRVPVLMHYQEGSFNSGIARLPAILKAYPKTIFIAHANSWWAHISAEVDHESGYPTGPIKPGGLTDHLLADYPNIYGDLSANSGRNALARDPDFAPKFLERHKTKLLFGSDCPCRDGMGAGQQGKCIARETLGMMTRMTSPAIFRQIAWENGMKLLGLPG
jgi:predicted TIM-barrel fold metal-dependent hydrolase